MHNSDIIVGQKSAPTVDHNEHVSISRVGIAYITEREEQALTEIELNRAKIVLVDENGKFIQLPTKNEH
ncbi:hypothetical protein ACFODT_05745 [Vibrio zhugei]|uniref:Uncharacterized protein n=1 Tax=Vibrio zhugei TaxID=2479546 RepID=A0ABV7C837_9VIBR|nr:hypothetical protein [Vibrio zhugei]